MWNSEQQNVRVATVGISVSIKGVISGSEDLTVDGQVEGRIDLPQHSLTIGPNATVVADINAKNITVFGAVVGSIVAREKADIRTSASVEGTLTCGRLAVQEGATIAAAIETNNRPAAAQASPSRSIT